MAGRVFINYRRLGTASHARNLLNAIEKEFGPNTAFMDVESIPLGIDFIDFLQASLADCTAFIIVIGPNWTNLIDEQGRRRLDDPDDSVRLEIVTALSRNIRVFPVLVEGAHMPKAEELPEALRSLTRRNAIKVSHELFKQDVQPLLNALREALEAAEPKAQPEPQPQTPPVIPPQDAAHPPDKSRPANDWLRGGRARVALVSLAALAVLAVFALTRWTQPPPRRPVSPVAPAVVAAADDVAALRPGQVFQDCADVCPEMVVVGGGEYTMGSPETEAGRFPDEGPQHKEHIAQFAVARRPVTVSQFRAFAADTHYNAGNACKTYAKGGVAAVVEGLDWTNPGFPQAQGPNHPVVCVNWDDAHAYAKWLTEKSAPPGGKPSHHYRLLSEAEYEYLERAGAATPYPWGADADQACSWGNVGDRDLAAALPRKPVVNCHDGYVFTAPVGHFRYNALGLHDMDGNVLSWVQDCYAAAYRAPLADGSPYDGRPDKSGDCSKRRLRGGSWNYNMPSYLRSAMRNWSNRTYRGNDTGFRVAVDG